MSDRENLTAEELNKILFTNLAMSMASAAMQHLGKLVNPMTGKTEVDIEAAQQTIDVIEMLAAKTKGNLDNDESRFLTQTLTALRLNYVETAKAAASKPAAVDAKADTPPAPPMGETQPSEPVEEKKKFSKKYD